jgi:tripartite-type tricarboxylate transporter receptor subunit TctC
VTILNDPAIAERLTSQGADPAPGTPDELARYMRLDHARWPKVIKTSGIRAD